MLNVFNRIVVVLLLAALILCAVLTAVGIWVVNMPAIQAALDTQLRNLVTSIGLLTPEIQVLVTAIALVVLFLTALVLILELRPPGGEEMIPVQTAEGGETTMAASAVTQRLRFAIDRLDDVVEVNPHISTRRGGIEVRLDVRTTPEIDVPMKDNEIKQVARSVIEGQMGLKLKKLSVRIDHTPFEEPSVH
jgi:hypothetical protein